MLQLYRGGWSLSRIDEVKLYRAMGSSDPKAMRDIVGDAQSTGEGRGSELKSGFGWRR